MVARFGVGVVLALLITSCGPEVFGLAYCVNNTLYDSPGSFPECDIHSFCGDGVCDRVQEAYVSCPEDCPAPVCGNGVCDEGEDLFCSDCEHIRDELE